MGAEFGSNVLNILGNGKAVLSSIAPALIERTDKDALMTARSNSYEGINNCVLCNIQNTRYPFMVADNSFNTLSAFRNEMRENIIRVGIIPANSALFTEMVKQGNGGIWFSACREGLYETYLPVMEKLIDKPTYIFVFDNDENITKIARERCRNSNIHILKCILHSVCSNIEYNREKHTVHMTCGKECLLVFPPEAWELRSLLKSNPFFGRAEFLFTDSEDAFKFFELWKPLGINVLHTLASVKAYVEGVNQGMSLNEITQKRFSDVISEQETLDHTLRVYEVFFDKYLAPYAYTIQTTKENLVTITTEFVKGLFRLEETVGRGLNPRDSSFDSKLKRHFPYLRASNDQETISMVDEFIKLLR
ncbi:MAG: hypothetical protein K2N34_04535 [Lachnospiraceae bacterium]|nr:hypothetical protein [Lachnospiraceae bacterium]